jgi:predicted metal-dependent phosphoesterase TrpH
VHPQLAIDLHAHTNVSDGTESPSELVVQALAEGLGTVAITDHDTSAGWAEAFEMSAGTALTLVPGIELSTLSDGASVHVLGYFIDQYNADLVSATAGIRAARLTRALRIVEKIGNDYPLTWNDVVAQAKSAETIARPHIADALVAKGIVVDRAQAFRDILHAGGDYFVAHHAPSPIEGVELICSADGVPVLAHPGASRQSLFNDRSIRDLVRAGLSGLELGHRDNPPDLLPRWETWARDFDLVITGSSDWHGNGKPNRLGEHTTDPAQFARIVERTKQ